MTDEPIIPPAICCGCWSDTVAPEVVPPGELHAGEPICVSCAHSLEMPVKAMSFEVYDGADCD